MTELRPLRRLCPPTIEEREELARRYVYGLSGRVMRKMIDDDEQDDMITQLEEATLID